MQKILISIVILFFISIGLGETAFANKTTSFPKLNKAHITMFVGEKFDINVVSKIAKSSYSWKSNNNKIVSVHSKNGQIVAKSIGRATIICTIKTKQGKKITLRSNVVVKEKPIFFRDQLMAHALGGLEGKYIYSNALEGLQQSINLGYRFIEVDLILTTDQQLVCSHGWDEQTYKHTGVPFNNQNPIMTYGQFMNLKIHGKYTTIDAAKIVEIMKQNKDLYFQLDLRILPKETAIHTAKAIIHVFNNNRDLLDRLLIQVGSREMYEGINSAFRFKYYQYIIRKSELNNIDQVIKFCKSKGIVSVAIDAKYVNNRLIKKIKENGLSILVHTVDSVKDAKMWLNKGVDTICTNFIKYSDLN